MQDLACWCESLRGKKLFILDEVGKSFPRRTPMAKLNIEMIKRLQTMRKYKLSLIFDTIDPTYTDSAFLGTAILDGVFTKPGFKTSKIVLYDDLLEDFHLEFYGVPRTHVKFDTWDSADFTLTRKKPRISLEDEKMQRFWDYVYGGKSVREIWGHQEKYRREIKNLLAEVLKHWSPSHISQERKNMNQ